MSCAHGVTPPTGPVATIVKTCSSPSEVCARADFALPYGRCTCLCYNIWLLKKLPWQKSEHRTSSL